jgi:hypothetical protein
MTVTKSSQNNLTSPNGNSLAVFVDKADITLKLKEIHGSIEPISNYICDLLRRLFLPFNLFNNN